MSHESTILIVDDEPAGRETLAALLRPLVYRLTFAAGGEEALERAAADLPDLVLLDVMMPGMDGFEVCRRMRADAMLAEVPIVLVTALDDRESRLEGLDAGADDFISKPFDRVELRARVHAITRLNRYRRLLAERERFARVFEFAPDAMLILDAAGRLALANPAAARLLEVADQAELLGRPLADLVAPDQYAACAECLRAVGAGGEGAARVETMLLTAVGRRVPVELHAGALTWNDQPALQLSLRDIADRKHAELLEEERRHLAFELHDGLAQVVTSVHLHLQAFASRYRPRSPQAQADLSLAQELARRSVAEVRRVIGGLRPTVLDDFGLAAALELHVGALREEGWELEYHENLGPERLPPTVETVIFRIALEALTNVRKHAGPTRGLLSLERGQGCVSLLVRDWGRGFDVAEQPARRRLGEGIGLRGIRERVALLGGRCRVESAPGAGTSVAAELPLPQPRGTHDGF
ncbi:MAG TPA: response regulator [Chloroflexaceae bacterium]|nr:response regulator [Chloroflexaceae bacterium]